MAVAPNLGSFSTLAALQSAFPPASTAVGATAYTNGLFYWNNGTAWINGNASTAAETAASITPTNYSYPPLDARRYGIDMTGATDASAIIAAILGMGWVLNFPAGNVKVNSTVTFAFGGIRGAGQNSTYFVVDGTGSSNVFVATGTGQPPNRPGGSYVTGSYFSDFSFVVASTAKTGGYGIYINPSSELLYVTIHDISFNGGLNGCYLNACPGFKISNCQFSVTSGGIGVEVLNSVSADDGDSSIVGCGFGGAHDTSSVAVLHAGSAGGLRLLNNKFLGCNRSYYWNGSPGGTSDITITGNSFENHYRAAIEFATGGISNITIVGNEIELVDNGTAPVYGVIAAVSPAGTIHNIGVSGNVFTQYDIHGGYAISLDYITTGIVVSNTVESTNGVGLNFGTHNTDLYYGNNVLNNNNSTTYINPGNAIALNSAPGTFFPYALSTSGINAATTEAFAAGGGTVCVPPVSITLTGTITIQSGVSYAGSSSSSNQGAGVSGTILNGNGTFPCFSHNTSGAGSQPYANSAALLAAMVQGFSLSNIGINNFTYGVQAGSNWNAGIQSGTFNNVVVTNCGTYGIWLENSQYITLNGCVINGCGNGFKGRSSNPFYNYGNITANGLIVYNTSPAGGRLVSIESANGSNADHYTVNGGGGTNNTTANVINQAASIGSGNAYVTVANGSAFGVGTPVLLSASPYNYVSGPLYFVVSVAGNNIGLATTPGGTAIVAGGTSSGFNVSSNGYCPFEVIHDSVSTTGMTDLNVRDWADESPSGYKFLLQTVKGGTITSGDLTGATGYPFFCLRGVTGFSINSQVEYSVDADSNTTLVTYQGPRLDLLGGTPTGMANSIGVGVQIVYPGSTWASGHTQVNNGAGVLCLTGSYSPDLVPNAPANALQFLRPLQVAAYPLSGTVNISGSNASTLLAHSNAANDTWTLVAITAQICGFVWILSNPQGSNTLTIATSSSQNIIGNGSSGTSLVIPPNCSVTLIASVIGATYFWTAVSVQNAAPTTGAQTATFTATNKPGSGTNGPTTWLPYVYNGTTYYIPLFGA